MNLYSFSRRIKFWISNWTKTDPGPDFGLVFAMSGLREAISTPEGREEGPFGPFSGEEAAACGELLRGALCCFAALLAYPLLRGVISLPRRQQRKRWTQKPAFSVRPQRSGS